MKKADMWVAILASLGVGAATYYTMSKSDQPINKALESVTPILSNMTSGGNSGENNSNMSSSNSSNQNSSSQNEDQSGLLGPHGMS